MFVCFKINLNLKQLSNTGEKIKLVHLASYQYFEQQ